MERKHVVGDGEADDGERELARAAAEFRAIGAVAPIPETMVVVVGIGVGRSVVEDKFPLLLGKVRGRNRGVEKAVQKQGDVGWGR